MRSGKCASFFNCKTGVRLCRVETPWRNGSASDSRSEGCVFESCRGQIFEVFIFCLFVEFNHEVLLLWICLAAWPDSITGDKNTMSA